MKREVQAVKFLLAFGVLIVGENAMAQTKDSMRTKQIDEVVITGQGAAISKRRISNTVTTINSKELEKVPSQRLDAQLSALVPNAQINLSGGQAGSTSIIKARGINSAFLNSTPIIYVDGVRMDNMNTRSAFGTSQASAMSSIADIPMDNIERIEYINGGAATTLYGADAANGVIQIFTKKGSGRGTNYSLLAETGFQTPTADFLYFKRTKDLLFENGYTQKYRFNMNGKSGKDFGYSFSASYLNSSGVQIFKQNENQKIDISTGFRTKLFEGMDYESSFSYVRNEYKHNRNGNLGGYTGLWFTESGASKITGPGFNNRLDDLTDQEFQAIRDYVREAERLQDNAITVNRFFTSQTVKYKPVNSLNIKLTGGLDYRTQKQNIITTNQYLSHTTGKPVTNQGSISNLTRDYLGVTGELTAQHTEKVRDFSFITTAGAQVFTTEDYQVSYSGTNVRDGAKLVSEAAVKTANDFLNQSVNYGIYLQENIGFKNKAFIDLGIRGDKNTSFGKEVGMQFYPKAGLSYVLSSEPWMGDFFSTLRLRANYGVAGNLPPAYANDKTVRFLGFGGEQAAFFGQLGNEFLKPEKTKTWEAGMDANFLDNRINLSAGYYNAKTIDALFYLRLAPSYGYSSNQLFNIGEIENKGWETRLSLVPVRTENTELTLSGSFNTVKNKVLDTGGAPAFNINGFSERTIQTVVQEGYPVGFLRGYYGIFDDNGVLKESIPLSYLGTTIPEYYGNIGLNFRYKNFNLFSSGSYQMGAYASNWDAQFRFLYGASDDNVPAGEINQNGRKNWLSFSNAFIEKTDFLKIRNIGMTYTFDLNNNQSLTAGFNAINPFNFAKSSFDPEATIPGGAQGQGGATTGGISYATYSAPREFLISLKYNF